MSRKLSTHGRKLKRQAGEKATADFFGNMRDYLVSVSTKSYLTADGEFSPVLLGDLAALLAVGAEVAAVKLPGTPEAKRIHAALRSVLGMSVNGRRWQLAQAKVLHEAAEMSCLLFMKWPSIGLLVAPSVFGLAQEIRLGTAQMDAVAGPEIYNKTPACAMQAGTDSY